MGNTHRRVVTENVNGKSVVQSDERLPAYTFETVSGYEHTLFWVNPVTPGVKKEQAARKESLSRLPGLADHFERDDDGKTVHLECATSRSARVQAALVICRYWWSAT
jgi:hypothetical protein